MGKREDFDIYERALNLAIRVAKLIDCLPRTTASIEYGSQVISSSGSIGANLEEANGTATKKDFLNKLVISRKEARETVHWLRLIKGVGLAHKEELKKELEWLIGESKELVLIISAIIRNTESK